MTQAEQRALITIALLAAHADGLNDPAELAAVQQLAGRLSAPVDGSGAGIDVATIEREVAGGKLALAEVVRPLSSPPLRQQAYEAAVGIAGADGAHTSTEAMFLAQLATALGLAPDSTQGFAQQAGAIVAAPLPATSNAGARPAPDEAALDQRILDAAVTNAALELLPESLASIAIIPLQLKLVWRIGQAYGYELDQGHIKDFLATLGVGFAGQYLEQFGRKILGGLLGAITGGIGRAIGNQAASSGMSFATTWAIGQIAKQYYAGGRTLDPQKLKAAFATLVTQAQTLSSRYAGDIAQRARTLDIKNLPALISQS